MRRAWVTRGSALVGVAAAVALFVFANAVAARFWTRWDLTGSGLYTLSDQTSKIVGELSRDVRITSFLMEGPMASPDVLQQVRTLLDGYRELNPARVTVEAIDPARDPSRARALLKEFDLDPLRDSIDVVVVQSGNRRMQVRLADMVEFDFAAGMEGPPPVKSLRVEGAITGAILGVTRDRKPVARFATGHGERETGTQGENGLSRLAAALQAQDVDTLEWDALGATEVPAGTDLLVIAGPRTPWLPNERDALARYLEAGGRALLLLDPLFARGSEQPVESGLEPVLARWGLAAGRDVVIDPSRAVPFFGPETLYAGTLGLHPVTQSLGGQPLLLILAQSIAPQHPLPAGVEVHALSETSPEAWGETRPGAAAGVAQDDADRRGPLALFAAVQPAAPKPDEPAPAAAPATAPAATAGTPRGTRLVVGGDSDFAANVAVDQLMNRSLALNAVSWLLEEERALAIAPKERALAKLFLTDRQSSVLFALLVLVFPAVAIAAGVGVALRRRRA